jgi:hypothetical protein
MKPPKNRKKAFRVDCINCHSTQDALHYTCSQCRNRLYTNMEEAEMQSISAKVDAMEQTLIDLDLPPAKKGNPFEPVDKAWLAYKELRTYAYIPGMTAYLDRVLEALLPIKIALLQRNMKANWMFLALLVGFPLVTLAFGMNWTVTVLLLLPAAVWLFVTYKAVKDLKRTRDRLAQITGQ